MQQTSRHFLHPLPLIFAGILLILCLVMPAIARAQSNQQVTVGVGSTTLTINGQTSPDTFITVLKNSTPVGTTSSGASGAFSLMLNFDTGGINQLSMFGRTSGGVITDPLIASINVVDHQNTDYYVFLPPSISLESTQVTIGQGIKVLGETIPGGMVTITTDTGSVIQATADSFGKWSTTFQAPGPGLHDLFAVAYDSLGQQSPSTRRISFMVRSNDTAPFPPTPITPIHPIPPVAPPVPIITNPQDNQYVNTRTITVKGSAEQGSLVEIWQDGHIAGSAYASAGRAWQIPVNLSTRHTVLRARTCRFGVCSDFSPPINVYFSVGLISGSLFSTIEISSFSLIAVTGQQLSLPLQIEGGTAPYRVTVAWGDHSTDTKTYTKAGRYVLAHTYSSTGLYNGTVTVQDSSKTDDVHHFAVRINERSLSSRLASASWWLGLVIITLLALKYLAPRLPFKRKR